MHNYKSEKQILSIIKYAHPLFILFIGIIITIFAYLEYFSILTTEKERLQTQYIKDNKQLIKEQVHKIHDYIISEKKLADDKLRKLLKNQANNAYIIATNIYEQNRHHKTDKEIQRMIKDALKDMRFNDGRGYYVIYDKSQKNTTNDKRKYPLKEILTLLNQKDEIFYTFFWYKSRFDTKKYKRLGYAKSFKPYDWIIGTGEFLDDHQKAVQSRVLEAIKKIRFGLNQTGYYCIFNYDGTILTHFNSQLIGKNFLLNQISQIQKENISNIISTAQKGSGYFSYIQSKKPITSTPMEKIAYIKGFKDWEWAIETGFYEDDIMQLIKKEKETLDHKFKQYIKNILMISLFITILFLMTSIYISKRLEKKFSDYKQEISNHIEEQTKQRDMLSQQTKMAAMGEMIGNIAHQWRQPLSLITTSATGMSLEKEMGTLNDSKFENGLSAINNAAQHLSSTIEAFRNFFREDKRMIKINLNETFEKTFQLIDAQFTNHEIKIVKNIHSVSILTIENELIQVLLNLLNNARDALLKSEIKRFIFLDVYEENQEVIIKVRDNSGGIPSEIIERIFEPYFTTKHKSQGTGIGLYMSQEIILKHLAGKMFVENKDFIYHNESYTGAEFTIILPINN